MSRTTSPIWNRWVFIVDSPVAAPPARAPRTSRGARAPRAPRTSAGAAPTLRAARAAARRPRRESIRPHPSSARAPLVRLEPRVETGRLRLQGDDLPLLLLRTVVSQVIGNPSREIGARTADLRRLSLVIHGDSLRSGEAQSPALLNISSRICCRRLSISAAASHSPASSCSIAALL